MLTGSFSLSRPTGVCSATGARFATGETYIATLSEPQPEGGHAPGLIRLDFSKDAWSRGARPPTALLGFWVAKYHPREDKPKPLLSDDELLDVFESTSQAQGEGPLRFRSLLALLLIRRRLLRVVGTKRRSGQAVLLVLRRGESQANTTPAEVVDMGLDEASIAEAIEQLAPLTEEPA